MSLKSAFFLMLRRTPFPDYSFLSLHPEKFPKNISQEKYTCADTMNEKQKNYSGRRSSWRLTEQA
jgi:hypothetical protein